MNKLPPPAEMEKAYLCRDAAYDGIFFVGVRTTGIFCRPTCPARSPLPKNVEYFASAAERSSPAIGRASAADRWPAQPAGMGDGPHGRVEADPSAESPTAISRLSASIRRRFVVTLLNSTA